MSILHTELQTPHFKAISQVCACPRINCGSVHEEPARIIFTRRGSFALHVGSRTFLARPGKALLVQRDVEFRISHPQAEGCDVCTDIWIDDAWLDMLGLGGPHAPPCREFDHDLQFQKLHVEMLLGFRQADDEFDAEEVLLTTLQLLLRPHVRDRLRAQGAATGRKVAKVEEAILGHATQNLPMEALAELAGCSPYYLCRIFHAATGQSMRQFRSQQRLGTALGRLGEGEDDLAALACDVGFSSHSHMTEAFRRTLGVSPREIRADLRQSRLSRLKRRLRAMPG